MLSADIGTAIRNMVPDVLVGEAVTVTEAMLHLRVRIVLRGQAPPGGVLHVGTLRAPPHLAARQGFNHWNRLDLAPGRCLALAGHISPAMVMAAVAGRSADPPDVHAEALRAAVAIADDPRNLVFSPALAAALARLAADEDDDVCLAVLLGLARADARLPRATAVSGLAGALDTLPAGSASEVPLAATLISPRLLDVEAGADPANRRIVASLAGRLLAGDAAMLPFLASALLREWHDDPLQQVALRASLLGGIVDRAALFQRLTALATADPDERDRIAALGMILRPQGR